MLKKPHVLSLPLLLLFSIFTLTGCDNTVETVLDKTDLIAKYAPPTFGEISAVLDPKIVSKEDQAPFWIFTLPDGNGFTFSTTFTNVADQQIFVHAQPFIDAGLDVTKLTEPYSYDPETQLIWVDIFISERDFSPQASESPEFFLIELLDKERDKICYHMSEDHYMIHDVGGNMVDFARVPKENNRDIILMLDPFPFMDAGLDPEKVQGWSYGPVKTHIDGRSVIVDKLILNYDLI